MRIGKPQITSERGKLTYQVNVESSEGKGNLWFHIHDSFGDLLTEKSDASLVALLIPAMSRGEDIYIDGVISERLYYNISQSFQDLLCNIIPYIKKVNIYPDKTTCERALPASGVATGFSAGIDSYCALADHYYSDIPESFKITHLLFNNVGSHGREGDNLFRKRFERLIPAAERIGLPLIGINSNLDDFYHGKLDFKQTHTMRNASVALLLQKGVGRFMYASSYQYSDTFVGSTNSIGYNDPITLPLLSTDTLDAFSVGSEYSRVQKTLRVAELPDSYATLDVCVNGNDGSDFINCSRCWKCLRTLTTLEIAGCLERYSKSFDLDIYRRRKKAYFSELLDSHDPLLMEITKLADERNYSFPLSSRLTHYSRIHPLMGFSKRCVRKMKHLTRRFT